MRRTVLFILAALCVIAWSAAFFLFRSRSDVRVAEIPTLMVLPSLTPTQTVSPTLLPTLTPTPTATLTVAPTTTPSPTPIPTLSERLLTFTVVMPGVVMPPQPTDYPFGTTILYEPPLPVEPLPDATESAPPFIGWYAFESDYPTVSYAPAWTPRLS